MNQEIDISNVVLRTERLLIRPWSQSDLDDVAENYDLYLGGYHKESGDASADNVIWCVQKKDSLFGNAAY